MPRLLCIDDLPQNLRLIEAIFARHDQLEVICADRGERGLDLAREHRPDVILLDLDLPDISGERVLECLKEQDETRWIPVIVLSGSVFESDRQRLLDAGASDFLGKPMAVGDLVAMVDRLVA